MISSKKSAEPIVEQILEPDLPIVDPHHHLWLRTPEQLKAILSDSSPFVDIVRSTPRYLLDEFLADINTGHNVIATVFLEAHAMYRASGPDAMKSVGEVEFVNGVAAMAASGAFGPTKVCAGIVGFADLTLGDAVEDVLLAHIRAGCGRYRGVRNHATYHPDENVLGAGGNAAPHVLAGKAFRAGFKYLSKHNLSFDVWLLDSQLNDLVDLAQAFPDTQIVLNHFGTPAGIGRAAGKREERFPMWRDGIRAVANCQNVTVKLGGLAMPIPGFASFGKNAPSEQLAAEWKPYIETCIEAFSVNRCMFESNYPVDSHGASYPVLWNAFKRSVAGASHDEKTALFSGTAKTVYRLDI